MTKFLATIPVLPTSDLARDIAWYAEKTGFAALNDEQVGYAILQRDGLEFHLQEHAATEDDPVLAGVMRIELQGILSLFEEFVQRGTVTADKLRRNTDWGTHEFGFYDPNGNAVFFFEDV